MQTEQLLCWSGMIDTEHTTSGSNEKGRRQKNIQEGEAIETARPRNFINKLSSVLSMAG